MIASEAPGRQLKKSLKLECFSVDVDLSTTSYPFTGKVSDLFFMQKGRNPVLLIVHTSNSYPIRIRGRSRPALVDISPSDDAALHHHHVL